MKIDQMIGIKNVKVVGGYVQNIYIKKNGSKYSTYLNNKLLKTIEN